MDAAMQFIELGFIFSIPSLLLLWAGNSGFAVSAILNIVVLVIALATGNIALFAIVNAVVSSLIGFVFPTTAIAEHRQKVRHARDQFYLREQEKYESTKQTPVA